VLDDEERLCHSNIPICENGDSMSRFLQLHTKAASLIGMFMAMLVVSRAAFPEAPEGELPIVKSSGLNDPKSTNIKPEPAGTDVPVVDPFFMLSGALLTESFDGPELDATLWSRPPWLVRNHKAIGLGFRTYETADADA
jgi:hypothetical protein